VATAREISFDILMAVESGGYAADLLTIRCEALPSRDAGLAASIVLGVLRCRSQLDFLVQHYSSKPAHKLDLEVLTALRMAIFQLRYLDRIPAHAAVTESVNLIKRARKRSAAGFANAILRKVNREPVTWPDRETELCVPAWMLRRWEQRYGRDTAEGIARAALETPQRHIRVPVGAEPPANAESTEIPGCYLTSDPQGFRIQDIGSQAVVPLLNLQAGGRHLDLCAAPGNKTAQALESGVQAVACDIHMSRLRQMNLNIPLVQLDAEQPLPFAPVFDSILVDAPCSGTGTLAHNPEIKWRLREDHLADLHARQSRILENAKRVLKPGGVLVYSTCSLEPEENEAVAGPASMQRIPGQSPGDGFFAAVIRGA
jgi:16S rRNA (cytosine967-C5)-methyltransferase